MSQTDIDRVQEFLGCQETGMVWRKADITDTSDRPGPVRGSVRPTRGKPRSKVRSRRGFLPALGIRRRPSFDPSVSTSTALGLKLGRTYAQSRR